MKVLIVVEIWLESWAKKKLSMLPFPATVTSEIKGSIKNLRTQAEVILEKIGLHALENMELQNPGTH